MEAQPSKDNYSTGTMSFYYHGVALYPTDERAIGYDLMKPAIHNDGMNCPFVDGHVERVDIYQTETAWNEGSGNGYGSLLFGNIK